MPGRVRRAQTALYPTPISASDRLVTAIRETLASKEATTADLGGTATSRQYTNAILERLR